MIQARGLVVRAGRVTLLDGVDLDVRDGEVVALVGPNGAGKSTLLATLAGDHAPDSGTLRLGGRDVGALAAHELAMMRAVLRQRSPLTAAYTALEVVQLGRRTTDDAAAHRLLAAVEMGPLAHRAYPTLSGGEQQRVQLARVLAQADGRPATAILLDEPTAALDLRHQQLIVHIARRAAAERHAVVVVLHDLELAAQCADRIVVLCAGRVLADGAPADVLTSELLSRAFDIPIRVEHTATGALLARPAPLS